MSRGLRCVALLAPVLATLGPAATAQRSGGLVIEPVRGIYGHLLEGPFLEPAGVYYDRWQKEIFVADRGGRRIAIADDRGFPTFSFGSAVSLTSPRGVATDRDGRIYVADRGHVGVRVFDYDGTVLPDLNLSSVPAGDEPLRAVGITVSESGELFVIDAANQRIVRVLPDGTGGAAFGPPAGRSDLLNAPADLDLGPGGEIVVIDAAGLPVQVYDRSGGFLRGWGNHDIGPDSFSLPAGVAVDEVGRVFVADSLRQDVKVFDAEGEFITNFGGFGTRPGDLLYPIGVASDRAGRVIVSERVGRRVQIYRVQQQ